PNNRILLGEVDTDPTGKFAIPVNNPLSAGVHTLAAQVSDDTGAVGPDGKITVTISGAPLPKISIGNVTQAEGNVGTSSFNFTITLDKSSTTAVTVDFTAADNTATV